MGAKKDSTAPLACLPHRVAQGDSRRGVKWSLVSPEIGRASQDHITPKDARPNSGETS